MRFRRVLAATDFSPASRAALLAARRLAASHRGVVWIANVVPPLVEAPGGLPRMYREMQALVQSDADRRLSAAVRAARKAGAAAHALKLHGPAPDAIRRAAVARKADLVVVGTHGRTGLPRLLVGSIAAKILATSPCPVLAVSRGAVSGRVRRVVFGTDFSNASRPAWATALALAKAQRARLRLVHAVAPLARVREPPGRTPKPRRPWSRRLEGECAGSSGMRDAPESGPTPWSRSARRTRCSLARRGVRKMHGSSWERTGEAAGGAPFSEAWPRVWSRPRPARCWSCAAARDRAGPAGRMWSSSQSRGRWRMSCGFRTC